MIQVSDKFKTAIYAPTRKTTAKVTFEILDVGAFENNTKTVISQAEISRLDQLTNKVREMTSKYATYERNYFRLDSSFVIPPKTTDAGFEVGWWSGDICDSEGVFNPHQIIEILLDEESSSIGLTISFDILANEYAADFDIAVYTGDNTLLHSQSIVGNIESVYALTKPLDDYKKVIVTIKKWGKGYRRARITEIDFGVIREYSDNSLIKLNMLEEISTTSETLPVSELKFTVDNSNKEFNILNPEGFYRFLQQRQEAVLEIGVEISEDTFEYVKMGNYYLSEWQSDEGALTTTFTAKNIIDLLDNYEMENLVAKNTNLYDLVVGLFTVAKITRYEIDIALKDITTQAIYKKMTCRQLLQCICIAGMAVAFTDREGRLIVKQLTNNTPIDNITFDNIYKEPQIKLDKLVSSVEVSIYDKGEVTSVYKANGAITGGATLKVENTLINNTATAQSVAEWILLESNLRALYDVNWRQNPALDLGDNITLEDSYGANKPSRIIKQEYEYQGYLSGKTTTKGGV